ncbi:MAG: hypothetical protein ACKOVB_04575 [Terrabacter sp.]
MKTRAAILATVLSAGVAGVAAGVAADRASAPVPPSVASTSVGEATPTTSTPAPPTTPVTPSRVHTATAEPIAPTTKIGPTPTAAPMPTRPAPSAATATPSPFGMPNLLVANDYIDSGISPVRISTAAEGEGQAAISMCQSRTPSEEEGLRKVFQGVAQGEMDAYQYVMLFRTETDARRAVSHVDEWRTWCPAKETSATSITAQGSTAHQVRLDGDAEGQWWTLRTSDGAYTRTELVAVVRAGSRVSVVDVGVPSGAALPDGATLVRRSAARLT